MDKQHSKTIRRTWRGSESGNAHRFTQNNTKKYQNRKRQAMIDYMDSGSKNSPPFMTV